MPKWMIYIALILLVGLLIPPALIAQQRATLKEKPRIHYVQDMDNQEKYKAQQVNPIFQDNRAMRPPVDGTVSREGLESDAHYYRGLVDDSWAERFPAQITVDEAFIRRGEERFDIYCMPCHGQAGFGDGIIHQRAQRLLLAGINGTQWVQPKSLHEQAIRDQPLGQTFNTITNGVRTMPAYGAQVPVRDRWAIVAYIKALQRSQHAMESDLPAGTTVDDLEVIPLPEAPADQQQQNGDGAGDGTQAGTVTTDSGSQDGGAGDS